IIYDNVKVESKDFRNKGSLIVHAHTGFSGDERPYIPGSSVKGAMLTGLMVQAARSSVRNFKPSDLNKIYDVVSKPQLKVKGMNRTITYSYAFGRAFRFSDFMPVGEYKLSIMTIERKRGASSKGGIPNVGVFLTSGKFEGELDYDAEEMRTFLDLFKNDDSHQWPFPFEGFFRDIDTVKKALDEMIEGIKYIDQNWAQIPDVHNGNPIITLGRYRGAKAMAISNFIGKRVNTMWYTQNGDRPGLIILKG
uniref:type III-A CRISPR-associated RAMP protein Csm5 n=1 Tax=Thermoplasma sp. TaxID=1973142 RepID=UPI002619F5BC